MNHRPCMILMKLNVDFWIPCKNMIQIGLVVPEMWPVKVKSRGRVYSSKRIYSAKYGIYTEGEWDFFQWVPWNLFGRPQNENSPVLKTFFDNLASILQCLGLVPAPPCWYLMNEEVLGCLHPWTTNLLLLSPPNTAIHDDCILFSNCHFVFVYDCR